jgi:hypothetical protein
MKDATFEKTYNNPNQAHVHVVENGRVQKNRRRDDRYCRRNESKYGYVVNVIFV